MLPGSRKVRTTERRASRKNWVQQRPGGTLGDGRLGYAARTSIALVPSVITSPGASSVGSSIRLSLTHVPFSDWRSSMTSQSVDQRAGPRRAGGRSQDRR